MSLPRSDFTATLLQNGKVLLAGGELSSGMGINYPAYTTLVDLFDPVTTTITQAAPMSGFRTGHTATLLLDGKVLVAGGSDKVTGVPYGGHVGNGISLASAEIYDPITDSWAQAASMLFPRAYAAAVLLTNGKVLVAGGRGNSTNPPGAEVYDPATNTWSSVTDASGDTRPFAPTATLLRDGRVLIVGGSDSDSGTTAAQVEVFDPSVNSILIDRFHPVGGGRNGATATLLGDNTLMIVGGLSNTDASDPGKATDIYDARNDACSPRTVQAFRWVPRLPWGTATTLQPC